MRPSCHEGLLIVRKYSLVGFLMGVPVTHMPDQLSRRGEICITELAAMGLGAGVGVDVVLKGGQRLEAPLAHGALMRPHTARFLRATLSETSRPIRSREIIGQGLDYMWSDQERFPMSSF